MRLISIRGKTYDRLKRWMVKRGPYVGRCSGVVMELDFSVPGSRRLFVRGTVEPHVQHVLLGLLRPGMTVIDVGANWGARVEESGA